MATASSEDAPVGAYPYAASPDIIRSNQKDAYFTSVLHADLVEVLRRMYGSRFVHKIDGETRAGTEIIYFMLTTLLGNRTLGEEYCDIHQVETATGKLPTLGRRAGYILGAIVIPYGLDRILPKLRTRIRQALEKRIAKGTKTSTSFQMQAYMLRNLQTVTSTAPIYALSLAVFYFSGAYYHLSKRIFGLRYIFSKKQAPEDQRVGYEVLGVLLLLQLLIQGYMHVKDTAAQDLTSDDATMQARNDEGNLARVANTTNTPLTTSARYDLSDPKVLAWLQPKQQRKCTLCLEPMKDPSVTTCGHVFCWTCIVDWTREKPECPLCRQAILAQHVLPLQG